MLGFIPILPAGDQTRKPDRFRLSRALFTTLIAIGLATPAGCRRQSQPCPTCKTAKLSNQWCDACQIGYVAGVPIKNRVLFECLDAHGHDLMLSTIECKECQAAIPMEGFCEKCRIGWVRKQAYFSRLTYHLAKGEPQEIDAIQCDECKKNAASFGWCQRCKQGMVGNVAISNRADYDGARRGYDLMLAAIRATERCETCGLAILTDNSCFFCKTAYKDGLPVAKATAAPSQP